MAFEVRAVSEIAASPEVVYDLITSADHWGEWCTWLRFEGGEIALGARPQFRLSPPEGGGYGFSPEIIALSRPHHFAWVGRTGVKGVFDGEHHFRITPSETGSRLENVEYYSGLMSPLMKRLPMMKGAESGFRSMNDEIRARAEALAHTGSR